MADLMGTARDCFNHLLKKSDRTELRNQLRELGISETSSYDYTRDYSFPKGLNHLKIIHFLCGRGYAPSELFEMDPAILLWGKLITQGTITLEQSAKAVGYSDPVHAFGPLLGQRNMGKKYVDRLTVYLAEHNLLEEKLGEPAIVPAVEPEPAPEAVRPIKSVARTRVAHASSAAQDATASRKTVDHAITLLGSLAILIDRDLKPTDPNIYDGDRMQIARSFERICNTVGIEAVFQPIDRSQLIPVTSDDMSGVKTQKRKARRDT